MSSELEWIEFKHNNHEPQEIGQYISAIANAAALHDQQVGFVVWGIADGTHEIVGTTFCPRTEKKGGELLESWLSRLLSPKVDFRFHEGVIGGRRVVVLEIPCAAPAPVRFDGEEYIRIGSSKKKLRDHWEKERKLWSRFSRVPFENGTARHDVSPDEVLELLAYAKLFELLKQPVPSTSDAIIARLEAEGFVRQNANGGYDITNLGAISFGQRLSKLGLERKAVRLVVYAGEERFDDSREYPGGRGYASSFEALVEFVDALLPTNEVIEKALRAGVPMYPMLAVRELIANALIHQDFSMTGTGPMIEVFSSRIEITNPGLPLIDPQRFLDATPRSRNEKLAMLMRRIGICEERGTGVDKVVRLAEMYQLPAPNFRVGPEHTVAVLYAPRPLAQMDRADRIRACYQHAVLQWMAHRQLTNASLRERLGISDANSAIASRLIADTLGEGLIKPEDPENRSRKHARYIPFFA
ncbi:MAG TPA: RNA-binding domain-containing protein [Longimicrobium sp.]|nr:RNA-binding domain-containing protein [Longimicrobium sp.]